jgi:hypothetical protein
MMNASYRLIANEALTKSYRRAILSGAKNLLFCSPRGKQILRRAEALLRMTPLT